MSMVLNPTLKKYLLTPKYEYLWTKLFNLLKKSMQQDLINEKNNNNSVITHPVGELSGNDIISKLAAPLYTIPVSNNNNDDINVLCFDIITNYKNALVGEVQTCLSWWHSNCSLFPHLSSLARDYLVISNSAPVERGFSVCTLLGNKRSSLSIKNQ